MNDKDYINASSLLIEYINKFSQMLIIQLEGTRETLNSTVVGVMGEIEALSKLASDGKSNAENLLEKTYFDPDSETVELMNEAQNVADSIMEGNDSKDQEKDIYQRNILRFSGRFSKHMEALETLDNSIQKPMLSIMGALSVDDKAMQRIDHTILVLSAFRVSLEYILVDTSQRLSAIHFEMISRDLLSYAWTVCTMNEERMVFRSLFPNLPLESRDNLTKDFKTAG